MGCWWWKPKAVKPVQQQRTAQAWAALLANPGLNGSQVTTYTHDIANRLTQVDEQPYTYDNNGNLLSDGVYTYTYDTANRLVELADGISTKTYEYNGDGVRIAQIEDGLRTDYVQDVAAVLPQV